MESVIRQLQQTALTEYEAKSYMALLNTHLCTATQVSKKAGVPRTKIYAVLESLKRKGWVHVFSGVPLHVRFARTILNIAWVNDKVMGISTMEYGKCVKCLAGTFEGGWRCAQKW
jgi:hypothetical protein